MLHQLPYTYLDISIKWLLNMVTWFHINTRKLHFSLFSDNLESAVLNNIIDRIFDTIMITFDQFHLLGNLDVRWYHPNLEKKVSSAPCYTFFSSSSFLFFNLTKTLWVISETSNNPNHLKVNFQPFRTLQRRCKYHLMLKIYYGFIMLPFLLVPRCFHQPVYVPLL